MDNPVLLLDLLTARSSVDIRYQKLPDRSHQIWAVNRGYGEVLVLEADRRLAARVSFSLNSSLYHSALEDIED